MSYGQEFKINDKTYLVEKNENYIDISEKLNNDTYKDISTYENYKDFLELKNGNLTYLHNHYDCNELMYLVLVESLNDNSIIDSRKEYKIFILEMINSGMDQEDILNSCSDENVIYNLHYPLDIEFKNFKIITEKIIIDYHRKNLPRDIT